ncbi:MAG: DUF5309 family protein [Marichromatium sp.]|nr:DUF5309 family protein [Marichromatium sp.]
MAEIYTTYDQVGKAEDVSDVISNIDPFDTPFQTMIGSETCKAINPSWQEDGMADPAAKAAPRVEGGDYAETARNPTRMRTNFTEIRGDAFKVSETSDAVRTHGRARETAYQLSKTGKEQKVAWEVRLLGHAPAAADAVAGTDATAGDESTTPRTAGNVFGKDASPVPADILAHRSAATTSQVAFDESAFLQGMQTTYDNGAPGRILMVSPNVSLMIKDWATLPSGRFRDSGQGKKLTMVVDFLITPFSGNEGVKVVLNRWMGMNTDGSKHTDDNGNAALLFDPSYWKIMTLRPWRTGPLAKVGDNHRHYIRGEFTLKHRNYNEGFAWVNLGAPVSG